MFGNFRRFGSVWFGYRFYTQPVYSLLFNVVQFMADKRLNTLKFRVRGRNVGKSIDLADNENLSLVTVYHPFVASLSTFYTDMTIPPLISALYCNSRGRKTVNNGSKRYQWSGLTQRYWVEWLIPALEVPGAIPSWGASVVALRKSHFRSY